MAAGSLIDAMFRLPYDYATPNILYEEELIEYYLELPGKGLHLLELVPECSVRMGNLGEMYSGVSSNAFAALSLVQQIEAPLLMGVGKLRQNLSRRRC